MLDQGNKRIQKFTPSADFISSWGKAGEKAGQFNNPFDIFVSSSGEIFIADTGNNRILRFRPRKGLFEPKTAPSPPLVPSKPKGGIVISPNEDSEKPPEKLPRSLKIHDLKEKN